MHSEMARSGLQLALLMLIWIVSMPLQASAQGGAYQEEHGTEHAGGPGAHAPIGVMGDHTHERHEIMLSYRYMRMRMGGMRDGDDRVSASSVLGDYIVSPTSMDMDMHMFGAMVAPTDGVTLMLMVPIVELEMNHRARTGARFTTYADGVGDVTAAALIDLWEVEGHQVHGQIGISFPTGSISESDRTPLSMGNRVRLPYPMQLGSGTYDFLPGLTYTGYENAWSWGAQAKGQIRLNENHAQYRQGNEYLVTAWGGYTINEWVSVSARLEWQQQLNYRGRDASIATVAMGTPIIPTADTGRRAFQRLDVLAGVNFQLPSGPLDGVRFAIEAGLPTYQHLDGPGLETDWITTVGVQYAFE
jgi:hypothetical protein